ncbi:hypothetical protein BDR26DRAFT_869601 [Obelidium mucronatum]|nr:hypothetical protein BDR26DRAFT_869601 [Obelidium mucronatum]
MAEKVEKRPQRTPTKRARFDPSIGNNQTVKSDARQRQIAEQWGNTSNYDASLKNVIPKDALRSLMSPKKMVKSAWTPERKMPVYLPEKTLTSCPIEKIIARPNQPEAIRESSVSSDISCPSSLYSVVSSNTMLTAPASESDSTTATTPTDSAATIPNKAHPTLRIPLDYVSIKYNRILVLMMPEFSNLSAKERASIKRAVGLYLQLNCRNPSNLALPSHEYIFQTAATSTTATSTTTTTTATGYTYLVPVYLVQEFIIWISKELGKAFPSHMVNTQPAMKKYVWQVAENFENVRELATAAAWKRTDESLAFSIPSGTASSVPIEQKRIEKGKTHKCSICPAVFDLASSLVNHRRCHVIREGNQSYNCTKCGVFFTRRIGLKHHREYFCTLG